MSAESEVTSAARSSTIGRLNGALAGRYSFQREIGRGGMATVYLAEDLRHGRPVAVKVFIPQVTSAVGPERFQREIEVVARLNHPHILALYDSGQADDLLFYVMPYVRGQSLRQALDTREQFPVGEAVRIATQIASALDHAHSLGLIHRDIKPQNILLHEGEAMLMDFGIARASGEVAGDALTQTGFVVGTPAYMSPEQALGEPGLDARSDLYSLACVLYEMLAGQRPFQGPTSAALVNQRLIDTAPSVRQVRSDIPAPVDYAIRRALARMAPDRFASAGTFAAALITQTDAPPAPSVAVLPFLNMSPDPDNEYFADGMTEDVIAQLSKVSSLKVISRTSAMAFKKRDQSLREIGSRLNASALLEGSVRRAGNRVRIVAQLVDAETDRHLWAETYDRQLTDVFEIQTDVALQIAAALKAALTPEDRSRIRQEPTTSMEAYQLYLQGRHCLLRYNEEGMQKAVTYFERAIDRDPGYALAHAGVAYALLELTITGGVSPEPAFHKARQSVEKALALDNTLADAHCMLGQIRMAWDYDWAGAEAEFPRALELCPNSADTYDLYARMCAMLDRYDEAIAMAKRANELDPLAHRSDVATTLIRAGRYDEALEAAEQAVEFDPHYDRAHATLGWALFMKGRRDEAVVELQHALSLSQGNPIWLSQLGQAFGAIGRRKEAWEVLERLEKLSDERYVSPYHYAYVHVGLGDHERALDLLEEAMERRAGAVSGIKGSFLFAPLRNHPRFVVLLKKMNLA